MTRRARGWWFAGGVLGAAGACAALVFGHLSGGRAVDLLSLLPSDTEGFVAVNWRRLAGSPAIDHLRKIGQRLGGLMPGGAKAYRQAALDFEQVRSLLVGARATKEGMRWMGILASTLPRYGLVTLLEQGLRMTRSEDGLWRRSTVAAGFLGDRYSLIGDREGVRRIRSVARGEQPSCSAAGRFADILEAIGTEPLIVAAWVLSPESARRYLGRLPDLPIPKSLGLTVDDEEAGVTLKLAGRFRSTAEAARAEDKLSDWISEKRTKLRLLGTFARSPKLMATMLEHTRVTRKGSIVQVTSYFKTQRRGAGVVGLVRALIAQGRRLFLRFTSRRRRREGGRQSP